MSQGERGSRVKRTLDRWTGCPIVWLLSLVHRKRPRPHDVGRIGVLMFGAIGDAVLSSAIIHDLRREYPSARITAFVSAANRGILELVEGPDAVVITPLSRPLRAVSMLREGRFDVLIDTAQWPRISAVLAALAAARHTIGFKTPRQLRHMAFDVAVPHSAQRHELDNFRALPGCLGITGQAPPRFKRELFEQAARERRPPYIVFHPWATGYRSHFREWSTENWVRLASIVIKRGYRVVITGGPQDVERSQALLAALGNPGEMEALAGRATLRDTTIALINARAVVSVNTGIMHIAALLGVPTLALHGPTNPRRWGPVGSNCTVIGPGPECGCAYLSLGFEYPAHPPDCMAAISVEEVVGHLERLLAGGPSSSRAFEAAKAPS